MCSHSAQIKNILSHPCEVVRANFNSSSLDRHFHDTFSIGFITSGLNAFSYRGNRVEVPAGGICIADPGEVHDGGLAGNPWSYVNIFVAPDLLKTLSTEKETHQTLAFKNGFISDKTASNQLSRLFKALLTTHDDQSSIDELALLAFGYLQSHYLVDCPTAAKQPEIAPIAKRAIEIINDYRGKEVSLELLSLETGASRYAVIRAVSASLGITPVAYMKQLRIEHAKQLIWGGMPIADAAHEAGFSDQPHLTREMKRQTGLTPGQLKL